MIVWIPVRRKGKTSYLGPYRYVIEEMVDPVSKVTELIMMGAYLEIEESEEEEACRVWRELPEPFRTEFGQAILAMQSAKRILDELSKS